MNLPEIFRRNGTDKYDHGYAPWYESHFWNLRQSPVNLLEIGVQYGPSLRSWPEYFPNKDATFTGIDIDPMCGDLTFDDPRVSVIVADAQIYPLQGPYDIIIDDGSHMAGEIVNVASHLWPQLKVGGWLVIEDWQSQWEPYYGGGISGSVAVDMMDTLMYRLLRGVCTEASELHVYSKIIFARKLS